jgi:hypothetical protein
VRMCSTLFGGIGIIACVYLGNSTSIEILVLVKSEVCKTKILVRCIPWSLCSDNTNRLLSRSK